MDERSGAWLRLTALTTAGGSLAVVVSAAAGLGLAHRVLAGLTIAPAIAVAVVAWWWRPALRTAASAALALLLAASGAGALIGAVGDSAAFRTAHVALAALAFAAACVVVLRAGRPTVPEGSLRDHLTLTKPRIMVLLLITALCAMLAAARGVPSPGLLLATMVGLGLGCGGASALNHVLDRDLDRRMKRTAARPVAAGRISAARATEFGVALSAASFVILASAVNLLAAGLCLSGNLFYVLVYTLWLKRRTAQNIVIGGAAGAIPPLVGWAAATGSLDLAAVLLFMIVFLWTPPHFWALAMMIRRDYERAEVPMLPVTRGDRRTASEIVLYTLALVAATLALAPADRLGWSYLLPAAVAGAVFVALAAALWQRPTTPRAGRLFRYSLLYLAVVFAAFALAAAA
ncbi:MAG: heme o synthase [Gaiellales bacterium]|jgi:protoheme IX farnesyltransferase|nr:heme o synthase [Gaiellales bacterium]